MASSSSSSSLFSRYFPRIHSTYTRYQSSPVGRSVTWSWKKRRSILFGLTATYIGTGYILLRYQAAKRDYVYPNTYLVWKFYPGSIVEVHGKPSLSYLLGTTSSGEEPPRVMELYEAIRALKTAANDPRIRGLLGDFSTLNWPSNIQSEGLGLAQIEELMQAIHEFKIAKDLQFPQPEKLSIADSQSSSLSQPEETSSSEVVAISSKPSEDSELPHLPSTMAFADTFTSQTSYLLASAFDKVYLQPSGSVPLTGLAAQLPFFSRLLTKLGVKIHTDARREYKSMISQYKEKDGLPPLQAQNEAQLLGELNRSVAYAIGTNRLRDLDGDEAADKIVEIMGNGPYTAKEALQLGLVDELKYKGDVIKLLKGEDTGRDADDVREEEEVDPRILKFKTLPHYSRVTNPFTNQKLKDDMYVPVAICYLRGTISAAPGDFSASEVVKGLKEAGDDKSIKAIILRIDSGGGDVVASDSVWHAVQRVKESSKKPVIVSFGNVAASGGYYAATAADAILASETTVTGSIGVASVRPVITRKLFDWAGISLQSYFTGSKANSPLHDMDEDQLKRQTLHIDATYEDFLDKVIQGRKIERRVVEDIAGGRVYTGLVAWTKTNPNALEAAEKEKDAQRATRTDSNISKSLIEQVEEALGLSGNDSKPQSGDIGEGSQLSGTASLLSKTKAPGDLAEWHIQDATAEGEMSTKLISMKAKTAVEQSNQDGATAQQTQRAEDVADRLRDLLRADTNQPDSPETPADDLAEAAHREAVITNGSSNRDQEDRAVRHAQESEATSSPYGSGLIDAIGGVWDAANLAVGIALQLEINALMAEEGLSREQALLALRPDCPRDINPEDQTVSLATDMKLIRYPRERSLKEKLREMNLKGDEPSLSIASMWGTLQSELGGMMARSLLSFLSENPGSFMREVAKRIEMGVRKEEEEMRRGVKMEYTGSGGFARL